MSLLFLLLPLVFGAKPVPPSGFDFKADHYERNLTDNSVVGRGNAWLKQGEQELQADRIEIDFNSQLSTAVGSVHIREGELEMWGKQGTYNLKTKEAVLDDGVIVKGTLVLSGKVVRKLGQEQFEIEEGTYSNCNLSLLKTPEVVHCFSDWKIFSRRMHVTSNEYAHLYDVVMYAKEVPVLYSPYLVFPVKSKRESGFLMPSMRYRQGLGTGFSLPYFLDLGPWQDLTLEPIYFSNAYLHLGSHYRYLYDGKRSGNAQLFLSQRNYGGAQDPVSENSIQSHSTRFGEWGLRVNNTYHFGPRTFSTQSVNYVSHPYFVIDFPDDMAPMSTFPSLRSQVTLSHSSSDLFYGARATYRQSLVISKEKGVDEGAATELPTLFFSKITDELLGRWAMFEFDSQLSHFYRPKAFDEVPLLPVDSGNNQDPNLGFDGNDYVRRGKRLKLEPRLITTIPMPSGFQFQPVLKGGGLLYHFDTPFSTGLHREYVDIEVPFSLYLSKKYAFDSEDFSKVVHIFQPRVLYNTSVYRSPELSHPFFYRDQSGLSNPRFDALDQLSEFEFFRAELINRFLRKRGESGLDRFLFIQLSQQFNSKLSDLNISTRHHVGPVELLSQLDLPHLSVGFAATYPIQKAPNGVRETSYSTGITYRGEGKDQVTLNGRFTNRAVRATSEEILRLGFYKMLPTVFDLGGSLEYSVKTGRFLSYVLGIYLEQKPRACWGLSFETGRDSNSIPFMNINFKLLFGNPSELRPQS